MDENIKVFINCPYDIEYVPMKQALMFAVLYCGFEPQLASMIQDAGYTRLDKIKKLINDTSYGIHDISRCKASKKNEWYRMNMPFEMGLDFGSRYFCCKDRKKNFLVLTNERYNLHPAFSDFSGNDPLCHKNEVDRLIKIVRDFFYSAVSSNSKEKFISKAEITVAYENFQTQLHKDFNGKKDDILEFRVGMGAESIKELLESIDLEKEYAELQAGLENATGQKRARIVKRSAANWSAFRCISASAAVWRTAASS